MTAFNASINAVRTGAYNQMMILVT